MNDVVFMRYVTPMQYGEFKRNLIYFAQIYFKVFWYKFNMLSQLF